VRIVAAAVRECKGGRPAARPRLGRPYQARRTTARVSRYSVKPAKPGAASWRTTRSSASTVNSSSTSWPGCNQTVRSMVSGVVQSYRTKPLCSQVRMEGEPSLTLRWR
jgi:hypothetical protein